MITGDHDRLQGIAKFNVCSEHKTPLEVAWYNKQWTLRCDGDYGHYPDAVTRNPSLTQMYKEGEELPSYIEDNIKKGRKRRAKMESKDKKTTELTLVPQVDLGTGELLVPELIQALVDYAHKYHLDPDRGHAVLMYGKPYVTLDGYLYQARKSGINYSLEGHPMSAEEKENYMLGATDLGWVTTITFTDSGQKFTGLGILTYREQQEPSKKDHSMPAHPVLANNPQLMVQKRGDWQALRRAFPIGED